MRGGGNEGAEAIKDKPSIVIGATKALSRDSFKSTKLAAGALALLKDEAPAIAKSKKKEGRSAKSQFFVALSHFSELL